MKRNLKKVLEGKAKKVSTNWYFEKKFKKRTSIERISILNWRVRLIRTLKLKLIIKKKNSGNVFLQSCENIIPNWELEWSVVYRVLDFGSLWHAILDLDVTHNQISCSLQYQQ